MSPPIGLSKWDRTLVVESIKRNSFVRQAEVHEFENTEAYGKISKAHILKINSLSVLFWSHIFSLYSAVALFWFNACINTTVTDCCKFQPTNLFCIQQSRCSFFKMEDVIVYSLSGDAVVTHTSQKTPYGVTTPAGDKVVNINCF